MASLSSADEYAKHQIKLSSDCATLLVSSVLGSHHVKDVSFTV